MIKLTILHYKLKTEALERYHNITEHVAGLMTEWEAANERALSTNEDYTKKPFIEPFEFIDSDYLTTEKPFRIRKEDVVGYKENTDNIVEIITSWDASYTVKETIEEIDDIFEI